MKYLRLYADQNGESHAEEIEATFEMQQYAPPAPEFGISTPTDAARYVFVNFPAKWTSELHPSPRRQLLVMISGQLKGGTSDGNALVLNSGDVLLMEDTTGKGHTAETLGNDPVHAIMVHLA